MRRREFLKVSAFAWTGAAAGTSCLRPPAPNTLGSVRDLAVELYESLSGPTRDAVAVPYDHPLRQYHNRGVTLGGARITRAHFDGHQRDLLKRLLYSGLSERGREIVPRQYFLRWMGFGSFSVVIAGDPHTPHYQVILSGPHLNLRLGGRNREGVAFGGPMIYGDQRGDFEQGLPGSVYRFQLERGRALYEALTPAQKDRARLARAPIQTQIEFRGSAGRFDGVPVKELDDEAKELVVGLVDDFLAVYHPDDAAYAKACLERNGGVDALYSSYYEDSEVDGSGQYQVFRLEGPAAVLYFRGFPHLHGFINVGMDGDRPLSVGEELSENPTVLEGAGLKAFFETVLRDTCETDFGYYDLDSAVGRLRTGMIRTGDMYNLESWRNTIHIASVRGSKLTGRAADELAKSGIELTPDKTYTFATTDFVVEEILGDAIGNARTRAQGVSLRDAAIAHVKRNGFPRPGD